MDQQVAQDRPNGLPVIEDDVPEGLEIRECPGQGKGIFATRRFRKGELMYTAKTTFVPNTRAKFLLRTANETHELDTSTHGYQSSRKRGFREVDGFASLVNHSCCPSSYSGVDVVYTNTGLTHKVVACREIYPGEQVTEDYDVFEMEDDLEVEMEDKLELGINACLCGAAACRGRIRGFKFLGYDDQCRLLGKVEDPIRKIWLEDHPEVLFKELVHPHDIRVRRVEGGLQLHTSYQSERPEIVNLEVVQKLIISFPSPDIDPQLPYVVQGAIKETKVIDLLVKFN